VRGLSAVLEVKRKPWVDIDGATLDAIAAQVQPCPSGALSYELRQRDMPAREDHAIA
jgi:uncharacterized Fe-S cluster protein YjdI